MEHAFPARLEPEEALLYKPTALPDIAWGLWLHMYEARLLVGCAQIPAVSKHFGAESPPSWSTMQIKKDIILRWFELYLFLQKSDY